MEEEQEKSSAMPEFFENMNYLSPRNGTSSSDSPENNVYQPTLRDFTAQIIASCIILSMVIESGINLTYGIIVIGGLSKNDSSMGTLNKDQSSTITSIATITVPIGAIIVGPLMDQFGRKKTCLISVFIIIVSWILASIAQSVPMLYAARAVSGFGSGMTTVEYIYISEITHPQIRQMLLCFTSIFVAVGILITYCFGAFASWRALAITCFVIYCFVFFILFYVPESPHWLLHFGNEKTKEKRIRLAENNLKRLNPTVNMYNYEREKLMKNFETTQNRLEVPKKSFRDAAKYYKKEISRPQAYKPIRILLVIFALQQLTGSYTVIIYATKIFEDVGNDFGNGIDKNGAAVILGVLKLCVSIATAHLSKNVKRRTLLTCSGIGMSISMFLSSLLLFISSSSSIDNENFFFKLSNKKWLQLVFFLLFAASFSFGFTIIPWGLTGELMPISVRGIFAGFFVAYTYIIMFVMTKSYPYVVDYVGIKVVFLFFGCMSLLATIFVRNYLPETLGKSLAEIEEFFAQKKKDSKSVDVFA